MDRSEVSAFVERELEPLVRRLGLTQWEIKLSFTCEASDDDGFLKRGECTRLVDYQSAHIGLNPEAFDSTDELLKTLRHELFHVVLAPFDLYTSLVATALEGNTPLQEMLDRVKEHACELSVFNLERMFQNLTGPADAIEDVEPDTLGEESSDEG
jgi:hypothetical protein